ncbi:MAG: hypothetical protein HZB36_04745 [Candidatus Omnitrophica bacterium]|nr:hypothetical protein [Candidatus Omnitrophota bacterium]
MSKRLVLLFCAVLALAFAVPAFAAVQNVKVSGDIIGRMINRNDFDLTKGTGTSGDDEVSVFNSVVRLRVDADLTDNVQTTIRLINERNWDENTATTSDIDLDLAYVTMKEFLYSPLTIAVGRQELHFGNDMIIGDGVGADANGTVVNSAGIGTNQFTNTTEAPAYTSNSGDLAYRKAFDAIRATLNYDPLVIDVVFAKIDENTINASDNNDDVNLYGANAGYKFGDKWNSFAEGYFFTRTVSGSVKPDVTHAIGGRVSTNPMAKVNLQQEIAWQGGQKIVSGAARDRNAWAAQSIATITPGWKNNPVIGMAYSYFSGDASVTNSNSDKTYHAWDPMFENQTSGRIINAMFPQWNAHNVNLNLTIKPSFLEDITLKTEWIYQSMAKANSSASSLTNAMGNSISFAANKRELGQEIDLTLTYDYTEDVQFALMSDWLFPGRALTAVNQKQTANEVIASCAVKF